MSVGRDRDLCGCVCPVHVEDMLSWNIATSSVQSIRWCHFNQVNCEEWLINDQTGAIYDIHAGFDAKIDLLSTRLIFADSSNRIKNSLLTVINVIKLKTFIKQVSMKYWHYCVWDGDNRLNCGGRRDQGLYPTASYLSHLSVFLPYESSSDSELSWRGQRKNMTYVIHAWKIHPGDTIQD